MAEYDPAFSGPAYPYIADQIYRQGAGTIAKGDGFFTSLRADGLKIFQTNDSDSYFTPLIVGITALPSAKPAVSSFQSLDPVWAGAHASEIKSWFHSNIVQ